MIVAITGGTGFIGRRLMAHHLESGDRVRVLTRKSSLVLNLPDAVHLYQADLTQKDHLSPFVDGADILYHCAGELKDTSQMHSTHVIGTQNLLEVSRGKIGRWVQLSSVGVYGPQKKGVITESSPLNPQGPYETTKTQSDHLIIEAGHHQGLKYSILRPSIVFGPGMKLNSLRQMITMIKKRLFFFIGPRGALATYIHVENVVKALLLCGQNKNAVGGTYILSDYRTLEDFVGLICQLLKKSPPQLRIPEYPLRSLISLLQIIPKMPLTISRIDALVNCCVYDSHRIETDLGYTHQVSIEEGLRQLINEN